MKTTVEDRVENRLELGCLALVGIIAVTMVAFFVGLVLLVWRGILL